MTLKYKKTQKLDILGANFAFFENYFTIKLFRYGHKILQDACCIK